MEGRTALVSKLGTEVGAILVFMKNKKSYVKRYGNQHEGMLMFSFQELNAFISHREDKLDEQALARVNKTMAKLSDADLSQDLDKI